MCVVFYIFTLIAHIGNIVGNPKSAAGGRNQTEDLLFRLVAKKALPRKNADFSLIFSAIKIGWARLSLANRQTEPYFLRRVYFKTT